MTDNVKFAPPGFPLRGNLYQKLPFFATLRAVIPHFQRHSGEIWHDSAYLGLPPSVLQKSLKNIYPFGENLYQKLTILAIFGPVSSHFKSNSGEIWREGAHLELPCSCQIL